MISSNYLQRFSKLSPKHCKTHWRLTSTIRPDSSTQFPQVKPEELYVLCETKSAQHRRNKRSTPDSPTAQLSYEVHLLELLGVFIVPEDYTERY